MAMTFGELSRALKNGAKPAVALNENGRKTARGSGYLLDKEAVAAVDVAIELGRPLLVSGEPGVGKTELGYAVARMLQIPELYLHSVKSTSDAGELFYTYDALQRLRDSQLGKAGDVGDYVEFRAMGRALLSAHRRSEVAPLLRGRHAEAWDNAAAPRRSVVVIDEIDKAPKDFPNDLLHEIESMSFRIKEYPGNPPPETPSFDKIERSLRPLVVITSNEERQLPDAFLRRCVFHEIPFPDDKRLEAIVNAGLANRLQRMGVKVDGDPPKLSDGTAARLVALTLKFREAQPDKKPGIAEIMDAAALLVGAGGSDLSVVRPAMVKLKRDGVLFQDAMRMVKN
ncbi:MoxR family ATPase [Bradyrhizobium sp. NBAIM32]|uniref:AAA family ATPase n=1 Tax=Bradyrhizobium sp. NBAIM32 TaxID=2793809 RepID=UPI001CD6F6C3|nr:MoxR family ATPase [Bradyrhizobium sp. NBAIM32]